MILEKSTRYSCDQKFLGFSKMLGGPNYFPFIRSYAFNYSQDTHCTIAMLQQLLPHAQPLDGTLTSGSVEELEQITLPFFAWEVDIHGTITQGNDPEFTMARNLMFWDIVRQAIAFPPVRCFIHTPAPKTYFTDTTIWSFCFVILSADYGIVLTGKTWIDKTSCLAEDKSEEDARKNFGMI